MNIFQKLGVKIADFGKWFAGEVKTIVGLALRIEHIPHGRGGVEAAMAYLAGESG